ncbi:50S ribosomal protein L11 methyltransferase [Phocaeicola oris]|uniref:50S ribosomal protein L11 methyltransferase n=1 Tax=Phocaeicola oris TaxID=2896850 RepID=UPI00234EF05A|nr:50S ribosomal protein L11 methyltransferase [Phocaeicola oris]MCE2616035.1 50S ribosomal protein L11 methyltransferase [Phocaeicola oris]
MKYLEVTFTIEPFNENYTDVLSAMAGEIGFESFLETESGIKAYIQDTLYNTNALKQMVEEFPLPNVKVIYSVANAEDKDWNEEWETNVFQPIIIDNRLCVHSSTHTDTPKVKYDIVINPQMAFGTGSHETTRNILSELLNMDLTGKTVLDMGCGTSILGILASMKGAESVTGIDIDEWSINNSKKNIELNRLHNIKIELGDAGCLKEKQPFDLILANINRNILLNDMPQYVHCMHSGSTLIMSGFYKEDLPLIQQKAQGLGLTFDHSKENNNWVVAVFKCKS